MAPYPPPPPGAAAAEHLPPPPAAAPPTLLTVRGLTTMVTYIRNQLHAQGYGNGLDAMVADMRILAIVTEYIRPPLDGKIAERSTEGIPLDNRTTYNELLAMPGVLPNSDTTVVDVLFNGAPQPVVAGGKRGRKTYRKKRKNKSRKRAKSRYF